METLEQLYKIKELGLKLVEFSYANQYMEMGDLNEITELKDNIINELLNLFDIKEYTKDDLKRILIKFKDSDLNEEEFLKDLKTKEFENSKGGLN